jgi:hypothetical protein
MPISTTSSGPRPQPIRNPALLALRPPQRRVPPVGSLLETLGLSCVLAAVAGALPLVMYLRG